MAWRILRDNLEAVIWTFALLWLAFSDPATGVHFTLCPLSNLGMDYCPGCGLGRAVSCALHGEFTGSFGQHLLGIPAIVILAARILTLTRATFQRYTKQHHLTNPTKEPVCPTSCN
jgi:hypothetical protein